jgi:hypothetical protein
VSNDGKLGDVLGGLFKGLLRDGLEVVRQEIEGTAQPRVASAKQVTVQPVVDASIDETSGESAEPVVLSVLEFCETLQKSWWTDPPFTQDEKQPIRFIRSEVIQHLLGLRAMVNGETHEAMNRARELAQYVNNGATLESQVSCARDVLNLVGTHEPTPFPGFTAHEGAFAMGVVFASYLQTHRATKQHLPVYMAMKRWFDQGIQAYETAQKEMQHAQTVPLEAPPGPLPDMRAKL